jgi:hypothetical protein
VFDGFATTKPAFRGDEGRARPRRRISHRALK